jgi:ribonuclease VapC
VIVDASAILAIMLREADAERFETALLDAQDGLLMSPVNALEAHIRLERISGAVMSQALDDVTEAFGIQTAPVDSAQLVLAKEAYSRFGKGNHPARLNLGDCFAYALAMAPSETSPSLSSKAARPRLRLTTSRLTSAKAKLWRWSASPARANR